LTEKRNSTIRPVFLEAIEQLQGEFDEMTKDGSDPTEDSARVLMNIVLLRLYAASPQRYAAVFVLFFYFLNYSFQQDRGKLVCYSSYNGTNSPSCVGSIPLANTLSRIRSICLHDDPLVAYFLFGRLQVIQGLVLIPKAFWKAMF
jgi:hypothetical protein